MVKMRMLCFMLLVATPVMAATIHPDEVWDAAVIAANATGNIEYFIQGKAGPGEKGNKTCEDGLFYSDDFLAVFDGATDKSGKSYNGDKGGRVARNIILDVFRRMPADATPRTVLDAINEEYQKFYTANPDIDFAKNPLFRPTATLIWYSFFRNELTAIGDSKARIDCKPYNDGSKMVDILNSDLRVKVIEELGLSADEVAKNDLGRFYIMPLLVKQSDFQNNPDAPKEFQYWAIDGFPIPDEKLVVYQFDQQPRLIELSTDGYEEFPAEASVQAYEEALAKLLKEDPMRIKNPSTKGIQEGSVSFDDRAILIWQAR